MTVALVEKTKRKIPAARRSTASFNIAKFKLSRNDFLWFYINASFCVYFCFYLILLLEEFSRYSLLYDQWYRVWSLIMISFHELDLSLFNTPCCWITINVIPLTRLQLNWIRMWLLICFFCKIRINKKFTVYVLVVYLIRKPGKLPKIFLTGGKTGNNRKCDSVKKS